MASVAALLLLAGLALVMASSTALFVRWAAGARTGLRAAVVVFLLLMMLGMLAGGLVYELWPSGRSAVAGLWLASVVMSASVAIVFVAFFHETRRLAVPGAPPLEVAWQRFLPTVVLLVVASESLMGWTFGVAAGSLPRFPAPGAYGVLQQAGRIVVSPWFTFPMVLEMALSLAWLRSTIAVPLARVLALQPLVMFFSPPALPGWAWVVGSAVGASAAMAGTVALFLLVAYRSGGLPLEMRPVAVGLLAAFVLMSAGLAAWAAVGSLALLTAGILVEMAVFLAAVLRPSRGAAAGGLAGPSAPAGAPGRGP